MKDRAFLPVDTPVGRLGIFCSDQFIIRLLLSNDNPAALLPEEDLTWLSMNSDTAAGRLAAQFAAQLGAYFAGRLRRFTVRPALEGTPFERAVWVGLLNIPYGCTVSYTRLAAMCGLRGARAVGSAVGRNPVPILVPCHRVIRQDGSLGGYRGGLPVKAKLLELEGWKPTRAALFDE